jgi:hypothetical protein
MEEENTIKILKEKAEESLKKGYKGDYANYMQKAINLDYQGKFLKVLKDNQFLAESYFEEFNIRLKEIEKQLKYMWQTLEEQSKLNDYETQIRTKD